MARLGALGVLAVNLKPYHCYDGTLVRITPFSFVASVLVGTSCLVACSSDEATASSGDGGPSADAASSTGGRTGSGGSHIGGRSSGGTSTSGGRNNGGAPSTDATVPDGSAGSGGGSTGGATGTGGGSTGGAPTAGGAGGAIATGGATGADSGLDASTGGRGTTSDAATGGTTGCPRTDASIGFRCNALAGLETYYESATKRLWVHANLAPLAVSGRYFVQYRLVSDGSDHCVSGDVQSQNGVPYIQWSGNESVQRFRIGALELVDPCGQVFSFTAENGNNCDAVELSPAGDASVIWSSSCANAGAGPCVTVTSCP